MLNKVDCLCLDYKDGNLVSREDLVIDSSYIDSILECMRYTDCHIVAECRRNRRFGLVVVKLVSSYGNRCKVMKFSYDRAYRC